MTVYIRQMSSVCIKNIVFEFASCTQKKKKKRGNLQICHVTTDLVFLLFNVFNKQITVWKLLKFPFKLFDKNFVEARQLLKLRNS